MSADRVRHGISRKGRFSLLYSHTQTYMCKQTYRNTHADIHMHLSMLQMMTPCAYILGASRKSKNCCILQMITFCLFLGVCVCVSKRGILKLISLQIPPNPFSLGPFSSYLLPSFFFKQLVSPKLSISICFHFTSSPFSFVFLVLFLSTLFFSPSSISLSRYQPCFCISNCCSNFTNMRVGRRFKKAQAPESLGVSPSCCWSSGMHLFH